MLQKVFKRFGDTIALLEKNNLSRFGFIDSFTKRRLHQDVRIVKSMNTCPPAVRQKADA